MSENETTRRDLAGRTARRLLDRWDAENTPPTANEIEQCLKLCDLHKSVRQLILRSGVGLNRKRGKARQEFDYAAVVAYFLRFGGLPIEHDSSDPRRNRGISGCAKYVAEVSGNSTSRSWVGGVITSPKFKNAFKALESNDLIKIDEPNLEEAILLLFDATGVHFMTVDVDGNGGKSPS